MSICDEIGKIRIRQSMLDKKICELYEAADKEFEILIHKGLISKRGCHLLSTENRVCNNTEFNRSNT